MRILPLLLLLFTNLGYAVDYYVSNTGSANNAGTSPSAPWTLEKAFSYDSYGNGDNVYIMGNFIKPSTSIAATDVRLTFAAAAGAGNTVTWQPYRNQVSRITAAKITATGGSGNHIFLNINFDSQEALSYHKTDSIERLQFWDGSIALDRIQFVNCGFRATPNAIGNMTVNVRGCIMNGVGGTAYEHGYYGGGGTGNKIIGNVFVVTGGEAIKYAPSSAVTSGQINSNIVINAGTFANPVGPGYGILIGPGAVNVNGLEVKDNTILSDPTATAVQDDNPLLLPGYASTSMSSWTITGNRVEGPDTTIFKLGTASGNTVSTLTISGNTFGINNLGSAVSRPIFYIFATQTTPTINNNAYYNKGAATVRWQYPDGVGYTDFTAWKSGTTFDSSSTFTGNSYPPDTVRVYKNYDEAGRANIVVINHAMATSKSGVDLTGIGLLNTEDFVIVPVEDYVKIQKFTTAQTFTYSGSTITMSLIANDDYSPTAWGTRVSGTFPNGGFIKNHADFTQPSTSRPRYSSWVVLQAPRRPTGVTATSPSSGRILISWTKPAGSDYSKFVIQRRVGGSTTWADRSTVTFTEDHFLDTTATAGFEWQYRVQSYSDRSPNASWSAIASYSVPSNPPDPQPPTWVPGSTEYDATRLILKPEWWAQPGELPLEQ